MLLSQKKLLKVGSKTTVTFCHFEQVLFIKSFEMKIVLRPNCTMHMQASGELASHCHGSIEKVQRIFNDYCDKTFY